ncbi:putative bifunctional diguanylate cyclase/phosphodiesterase [Roseovarius arcticus]|uniref:putative bifunctional diguanylate cyclase/phosphodiesterase n=1 Tax=Roseovarius arcticus TaxID=2547404 RepID=UPI0011105C5C|nr:EAL domain-containing protein [Roseovarius arcticus]
MYRVFECITQEHDYWLVAVAAFVCIAGSSLTVLTLRRLIAANGPRKKVQLGMSALITGATIWSTHFIAMLAYDPGVEHGYEPVFTGLSLGIAVAGALAANAFLAFGNGQSNYIFAGAGFGLTVSVMHYTGMSAYQLPGEVIWHLDTLVASVALGVGIGIGSYHRIMKPATRFCWLGGAALMVLAICTMHFTGMSAIEIRLNSTFAVPPQLLSDMVLGMLILSVVTLILFIGFSAFNIETNLEREAVARLEYTVLHDHLTQLPNRLHLKRKLDELSKRLASDATANVAVVSIDLDLFKQVNDVHGHQVGDQVLKEVSLRLKNCFGENEFVARIGGDEFVALKTDVEDTDDAIDFANLTYGAIIPTIHEGNCAINMSASLGIATSMNDGSDMNQLLQKSDLAMFRAKQDPDRNICQYDADMDMKFREKNNLIRDLRHASSNDQFELIYQLQNEVKSREPIGCEVLLRWCHPTKGIISPDEFIPIAEETGLIQDIGLWVLRTACIEAASWSSSLKIAVNVAPQQLSQPTFIEDLLDILMESRLPPERLELEITEASVIHDQALALKVLKKIKGMGVRIAMDDFGTGYSSLAMLQTFPFDKIKIDRSFVQDLHLNHQRAAIFRSTLSLGQAFGIPVLAEGVETEDELSFLNAEGCTLVQGFYFGQPMSSEAIRGITTPIKISRAS